MTTLSFECEDLLCDLVPTLREKFNEVGEVSSIRVGTAAANALHFVFAPRDKNGNAPQIESDLILRFKGAVVRRDKSLRPRETLIVGVSK